ncbi:hypothetical protein [Methanocrinis sp.]|uniref:hypothetical protein n=1 Tax=Methanocrinis sp. TaxID=3101522 RepID=UPI003D09C632
MLLHEILKIDDGEEVFLAEESLADLITLPVTSEILSSGLKVEESIEVLEERGEEEDGEGRTALLGVALKLTEPAEIWLLLTDRYSGTGGLEALPRSSSPRIVEVSEERFLGGLVEWLSISLSFELFCESCPVASPPLFVPERIEGLVRFLEPLLPAGGELLEICCGSGMATQALKRLGYRPWTEDLDSCEVCMALKSGYIDSERAMVLDARLLDRFFPPLHFDAVVGFMVGLIDEVNWSLWKEILLRSSALARDMVIYTTYTERESQMVAEALRSDGWIGEVVANPDDLGIYDQWAFVGRRRG